MIQRHYHLESINGDKIKHATETFPIVLMKVLMKVLTELEFSDELCFTSTRLMCVCVYFTNPFKNLFLLQIEDHVSKFPIISVDARMKGEWNGVSEEKTITLAKNGDYNFVT